MSNWARTGIAILASLSLTAIGYLLPYTPMLYFFAPGFWLGDALPDGAVNSLGGYLFPVFASLVIWALLIYCALWLISRRPKRILLRSNKILL
ncbi:MAG TPA: hypothetical protein VJT09_03925 [Pyrinomonadaceae bacterium]|nr:hypothetical protein [Pyrinomonadaceae bacterium]